MGGWRGDGGEGSKESTVCLCVQRTKRFTNNEHRGKRGAVLTAKVGGCSQTENVEEVVQNTLPPPSGFPKKKGTHKYVFYDIKRKMCRIDSFLTSDTDLTLWRALLLQIRFPLRFLNRAGTVWRSRPTGISWRKYEEGQFFGGRAEEKVSNKFSRRRAPAGCVGVLL